MVNNSLNFIVVWEMRYLDFLVVTKQSKKLLPQQVEILKFCYTADTWIDIKSPANLRLQVDIGGNKLFKCARQEDSKLCEAIKHLNWANSKGKKLNYVNF